MVSFTIRRISQTIFFMAFIALLIFGRVQLWMMAFILSLAAAVYFGRFYCGWLCPINTVTETASHIYESRGIQRKAVPKWVKSPFVRYGILMLFLGTMVYVQKSGQPLPVLPALMLTAAALTLVFVPSLWHRYLCPYGALLGITGKFARRSWRVESSQCTKCGKCIRVCPGAAVEADNDEVYPQIKKELCLSCNACAAACPKKTIKYK